MTVLLKYQEGHQPVTNLLQLIVKVLFRGTLPTWYNYSVQNKHSKQNLRVVIK